MFVWLSGTENICIQVCVVYHHLADFVVEDLIKIEQLCAVGLLECCSKLGTTIPRNRQQAVSFFPFQLVTVNRVRCGQLSGSWRLSWSWSCCWWLSNNLLPGMSCRSGKTGPSIQQFLMILLFQCNKIFAHHLVLFHQCLNYI